MSVVCRQSGTGNSAPIHADLAVVSAYPFTIAGWAKPAADDMAASYGVAAATTNPPDTQYHAVQFAGAEAGDPLRAISFIGGSSGIAETSSGYSQDTWTHFAAVFTNATSRTIYIDGGNSDTDTTNKAVGALADFFVGSTRFNTATFYGHIGFVGVWTIALDAGEVTSLAGGAYPDTIQNGNLAAYWKLVEDGTDEIANQQLMDYSVGPQWFVAENPLAPGGEWVVPDGFTDPESVWNNEANAYDDNTATFARSWVHASDTSEWLYVTLSTSILADKVRFYCNKFAEPGIEDSDIQIDVYYNNGWHTVYNDNLHLNTAWRSAIFGGTYTISQARIRMTNSSIMDDNVEVYEIQFWKTGVTEDPIPVFLSPNIAAAPGGTGATVTLTNIGLFSVGAPTGIDDDNPVLLAIKDSSDNMICSQTYDTGNAFPTDDYDALGSSLGYDLSPESPVFASITRPVGVTLPEFWLVFTYLRDGHTMCSQTRVEAIS